MAERGRVQFLDLVCAVAVVVGLLGIWFWPAKAFLEPVGSDITHTVIRQSAFLPVVFWCLGWPVAFAPRRVAGAARITWAVGCLLLLLHIAIAFHLGHGWSHQAAWKHTKQVGGYGDGIFVNYAFALVWLADVVWAWIAFGSYRARPRWLNWTIHGFLAFVVFNAAVVFGSEDARAAFAVPFLIALVFVLWMRNAPPANPETGAITDIDAK